MILIPDRVSVHTKPKISRKKLKWHESHSGLVSVRCETLNGVFCSDTSVFLVNFISLEQGKRYDVSLKKLFMKRRCDKGKD